jgi:hypothetical protein
MNGTAEVLEHAWFEPLLGALRRRQLNALTLLTLHERQALGFELSASDLWKFWRRASGVGAGAHA